MTGNGNGPAAQPDRHQETEAASPQPIAAEDNAPGCQHGYLVKFCHFCRSINLTDAGEDQDAPSLTEPRARALGALRLPPFHDGPTRDPDGLGDRDPWIAS